MVIRAQISALLPHKKNCSLTRLLDGKTCSSADDQQSTGCALVEIAERWVCCLALEFVGTGEMRGGKREVVFLSEKCEQVK